MHVTESQRGEPLLLEKDVSLKITTEKIFSLIITSCTSDGKGCTDKPLQRQMILPRQSAKNIKFPLLPCRDYSTGFEADIKRKQQHASYNCRFSIGCICTNAQHYVSVISNFPAQGYLVEILALLYCGHFKIIS